MRAAAAVATRHPLLPALSSWPPPAFAYPQLRELRGIIEHMHIREDSYRKVCACARCGGGGVSGGAASRHDGSLQHPRQQQAHMAHAVQVLQGGTPSLEC